MPDVFLSRTADREHQPSGYLRRLAIACVGALCMIGMSACAGQQTQRATAAPTAQGQSTRAQDAQTQSGVDAVPASASQDIENSTAESPSAPSGASVHVLSQKLQGYWLLDGDATLQNMPPEDQAKLRHVFEKVSTGMVFTNDGTVTMNVEEGGNTDSQSGHYDVVSENGNTLTIEFIVADPAMTIGGVRSYASIEFVDDGTISYHAFTKKKDKVVQKERPSIMRRVNRKTYDDTLK